MEAEIAHKLQHLHLAGRQPPGLGQGSSWQHQHPQQRQAEAFAPRSDPAAQQQQFGHHHHHHHQQEQQRSYGRQTEASYGAMGSGLQRHQASEHGAPSPFLPQSSPGNTALNLSALRLQLPAAQTPLMESMDDLKQALPGAESPPALGMQGSPQPKQSNVVWDDTGIHFLGDEDPAESDLVFLMAEASLQPAAPSHMSYYA